MDDSEDLWRYSLRVYAIADVARVCLEMQESYGTDTNILLFCLWSARRFGALEQAFLKSAAEHTHAWQMNVVRPIRQGRKLIKSAVAYSGEAKNILTELYERAKLTEIETERAEQAMLEKLTVNLPIVAGPLTQQREDAEHNLNTYATQLGIVIDDKIIAYFRLLISTAMSCATHEPFRP